MPLYSQSAKVRRVIKKQEKNEKNQKKDYEKSRKEALKHRYKIQTPEVQERMKSSREKVNKYHKNKNKPVIKDIFKRKKRKRR
jgi:hypothetical protein